MTPFEDYNNRYGNIIQTLIMNHGWYSSGRTNERIYIIPPNIDKKKHSKAGSFHFKTKRLFLWDSDGKLEIRTPYSPVDLFIIYEMNGDHRNQSDIEEAAKKLSAMGFGDKSK